MLEAWGLYTADSGAGAGDETTDKNDEKQR
jgi:hypothetical protein